MAKGYYRNSFGYDGTKPTSRRLQDLLPQVLRSLQGKYNTQPKLLLEAWADIIGETLAPLTKASRFEDGVLHVNVKNSTLLSLLHSPQDKQKIIEAIRQALPGIMIRNIVFRIG
jgi:hypothetical protein